VGRAGAAARGGSWGAWVGGGAGGGNGGGFPMGGGQAAASARPAPDHPRPATGGALRRPRGSPAGSPIHPRRGAGGGGPEPPPSGVGHERGGEIPGSLAPRSARISGSQPPPPLRRPGLHRPRARDRPLSFIELFSTERPTGALSPFSSAGTAPARSHWNAVMLPTPAPTRLGAPGTRQCSPHRRFDHRTAAGEEKVPPRPSGAATLTAVSHKPRPALKRGVCFLFFCRAPSGHRGREGWRPGAP